MLFRSTLNIAVLNRCHVRRRLSQLSDIRSQLMRFEGGSVSLKYSSNDSSVAVISACNAEKRNAFSGTMCLSLNEAINELQSWKEGRAVIVRGLNGLFCAGADLSMAKQIADSESGEKFSCFMQNTLTSLKKLRIPSFALVQGNVLGGGAELMVACDYVVAARNTKISFVQGRMGIVPGWAGATHLNLKVGYQKALDMLITSKVMDASSAKDLGLIDHIIQSDDDNLSDEQLLELGLTYVDSRISKLPPEVVQGLKQVAYGACTLSYEDSIVNERTEFKALWGGEANLRAFSQNLKHVSTK